MKSIENIPKTMKVLNLRDINDLRLENKEIPELQKDSVILHIKNCGICSSDNERVFTSGTYHFPTVIGHEFAGQIIAVNDEDEKLLGQKAAVFPLLPCKECEACKIEEYAQCKNYSYFGSRCDGGDSEYLVVPKWNLVLENDLDYPLLALCEPAAVALHAIRRIKNLINQKVFIMGGGTIGLLISLFLKDQGNEVYVGIRKKEGINFAKTLGLHVIDTNNLEEEIEKNTNGEGFKYVYEVVGSNESIANCIKSAGNFANIVVVGNPKSDLNIPKDIYWKILRKQITIIGTWNSNYNQKINDWADALTKIKNNPDLYKKLITHIYKIDDYKKAFNLLKDKNEFKIKIMIEMSGENE